MIDAVHRYDGYVMQSTGDGIFALFGAPLTHEDHPQRAPYAALRMHEELRTLLGKIAEQTRKFVKGYFQIKRWVQARSRASASR